MRIRQTAHLPGLYSIGIALLVLLLSGCGGGGGGGSTVPSSSTAVSGTVSGTVIVAIDENGNIAGRDDTNGRAAVDNTIPSRYRFSLNLPQGRKYNFYFIVGVGTAAERIVPLSFGSTNVISVGSATSIDLGFVNTSGAEAVAEKNPFSTAGVTPGARTGPPTIKLEGYRILILLDQPDGKRYRAQVRIKDAAGNAVANGSLVKSMKIYGPAGAELATNGTFSVWNGTGIYTDNGAGIASESLSDVILNLSASPGTLSTGFYTVNITDNNGNLYATKLYFEAPTETARPSGLSQSINADNSIAFSWTNPGGISAPASAVYLYLLYDDGNGDGIKDTALIAWMDPPGNTYTVPASFVRNNLVGKTGLQWMVEIRKQTGSEIAYPDGTTSAAPIYRIRSAATNVSLPAVSAVFIQGDLAGTWDVVHFQSTSSSGPGGGGWLRTTVRIDGGGALYMDDNRTWQAGGGPAGVPVPPNGPLGIAWTIDSAGAITETGAGSNSTFHGYMASNKQLVVGTVTLSAYDKGIRIFRKRVPGVTFSNSELYGNPFTFHELDTVVWNEWNRGYGTINGSGMISGYAYSSSSGGSGPFGPEGPMSIDAAGIVTMSGDPAFGGVMTADKSAIFATTTNYGTSYGFLVITPSGQTFATSDLAGPWRAATLTTGTKSTWLYGMLTMDATGTGSWAGVTGSEPETLGPVAWTLSSAGEVLDPGSPSWAGFQGNMSTGKNLLCITASEGATEFGISILVK